MVDRRDSNLSIFVTFLRFGIQAWGGPVAQIAMIREELVERREWITPEKFRRALAVYQALPGPEAHELCVYFGMVRAGRIGGFLAGLGFMLPGFLLMLLLSSAYAIYGSETLLPLFVGVTPAVAALILRAAYRLGRHVLADVSQCIACVAAIVLTLIGVHFSMVFIACAAWQALWTAGRRRWAIVAGIILSGTAILAHWASPIPDTIQTKGTGNLLLEGLKAGLLSFGGAYTAIPFLRSSMVGAYPAITQQVFLDGIALGSVIPAPLIIFGTFLGYIADGLAGALLMTFGIFLPAFSFTLLGHRQLERIIENKTLHGGLDGISAAVVGLLLVTAFSIFQQVVTGSVQLCLFFGAIAALTYFNHKWVIPAVILASGLAGYFLI